MVGPRIEKLSVGPMDNNVYIIRCGDQNESIGVDAANDIDTILAAVAGTNVRYILQTHGHADHVQALTALKSATGAPVAVHPDDAAMLPVSPDRLLADGDEFPCGDHVIK